MGALERWDPSTLYRNASALEDARAPCAKHSLNSKAFVLRETSSGVLELVGRKSARRTANVLLFFGVSVLIGAVVVIMHSFFAALFCAAFGTIFVWIGRFTLRDLDRRRVFDKQAQLFIKAAAGDEAELRVPFADITALQLLKKHVKRSRDGETGGYDCLELNLVLRDGTRTHVVVDGGVRRLEKDARTLADLLGVPLWEADAFKLLDLTT